ncbi:hypothetical protein CY34DRAFT_18220 [Suillus luteus UH-Slu-Lm8-n1]|uniref:Uncharacterized protein n=1 Tax=Suillus luteus UH-Slu-Lm8-n1 TaxID=930992 RepID=A0A0D0A623_9AGAM|nr:hypothetical protein CY34DRAFT_18220 [Suillus luteus UH-Slu-Lm8-n1]
MAVIGILEQVEPCIDFMKSGSVNGPTVSSKLPYHGDGLDIQPPVPEPLHAWGGSSFDIIAADSRAFEAIGSDVLIGYETVEHSEVGAEKSRAHLLTASIPSLGRTQTTTTTNSDRTRIASNPPDPEKEKVGPKLLVTEGSFIPGESEEDGLIRKEYVLIDPHAVEFTRELNSARRLLWDRRVPLPPLASESRPPDHTAPSPSGSPQSTPTLPPPPHPLAPPLSSSPTRAATNTLSRALSLASHKLFGTSTPKSPTSPGSDHYRSSSSPRRPQPILWTPSERETEIDPMEEELLANLEDLAQKTDILTHWVDELYEQGKAIPHRPLADPIKNLVARIVKALEEWNDRYHPDGCDPKRHDHTQNLKCQE